MSAPAATIESFCWSGLRKKRKKKRTERRSGSGKMGQQSGLAAHSMGEGEGSASTSAPAIVATAPSPATALPPAPAASSSAPTGTVASSDSDDCTKARADVEVETENEVRAQLAEALPMPRTRLTAQEQAYIRLGARERVQRDTGHGYYLHPADEWVEYGEIATDLHRRTRGAESVANFRKLLALPDLPDTVEVREGEPLAFP